MTSNAHSRCQVQTWLVDPSKSLLDEVESSLDVLDAVAPSTVLGIPNHAATSHGQGMVHDNTEETSKIISKVEGEFDRLHVLASNVSALALDIVDPTELHKNGLDPSKEYADYLGRNITADSVKQADVPLHVLFAGGKHLEDHVLDCFFDLFTNLPKEDRKKQVAAVLEVPGLGSIDMIPDAIVNSEHIRSRRSDVMKGVPANFDLSIEVKCLIDPLLRQMQIDLSLPHAERYARMKKRLESMSLLNSDGEINLLHPIAIQAGMYCIRRHQEVRPAFGFLLILLPEGLAVMRLQIGTDQEQEICDFLRLTSRSLFGLKLAQYSKNTFKLKQRVVEKVRNNKLQKDPTNKLVVKLGKRSQFHTFRLKRIWPYKLGSIGSTKHSQETAYSRQVQMNTKEAYLAKAGAGITKIIPE